MNIWKYAKREALLFPAHKGKGAVKKYFKKSGNKSLIRYGNGLMSKQTDLKPYVVGPSKKG